MNDVPVLDKEMSTTGKTYLIVLWKNMLLYFNPVMLI
jgi:hypothetical protein